MGTFDCPDEHDRSPEGGRIEPEAWQTLFDNHFKRVKFTQLFSVIDHDR